MTESILKKSTNHGGARKGAGRKDEGKTQVSYKLAPDVVSFLRLSDKPASVMIENAVRHYYNLPVVKSQQSDN